MHSLDFLVTESLHSCARIRQSETIKCDQSSAQGGQTVSATATAAARTSCLCLQVSHVGREQCCLGRADQQLLLLILIFLGKWGGFKGVEHFCLSIF